MKNSSDKSRIRRIPKRGIYEREEIYAILDKECVCHVSFIYEGYPVIIPTIYGRKGNFLYLHGATSSRMLKTLAQGVPLCIAVTLTHGIVLARSVFHSSMNYESVVIFGKGRLIEDEAQKTTGLEVVTNHIVAGRWEEARKPNPTELKATSLIEVEIEEASAKRRTGNASDDKEDYQLNIWAGVIPFERKIYEVIPDPEMQNEIPIPESVKNYVSKNRDEI